MTWEEKLSAMQALTDVRLCMAEPGSWHLDLPGVEINQGGILGSVFGRGPTPQGAVEVAWRTLTNLPPNHYIVVGAYQDTRKAWRWRGYMWQEVVEPVAERGGATYERQ